MTDGATGPLQAAGPASATAGAGAGSAAALESAEVARSLRACDWAVRRHAPDLRHCLKLTPQPRRSALSCIYALSHACDRLLDGADTGDVPAATALERTERFRHDIRQTVESDADSPLPPGPLWPALRHVVRAYEIDPAHLYAMLEGRRRDLLVDRYETFDDLYRHCYQVGSAAGLACLNIQGHDGDPGVPKLTEYRGVALQLTRILRDLAHDARRGHVYLPREDFDRFGCTIDQIHAADADVNLERLVVFQAERARSYYQMSDSLERHLAASSRPTSWAMMQTERQRLERIARAPRRVMTHRVRIGPLRRLSIAARATWKQTWT